MKSAMPGMARDQAGRRRSCGLLWLLACAAPLALGAEAEERARINTERAAARAAFEARERECQTHFVVTACVEVARRDQREVLTLLRRQEMLLEETQRRERAAQRLESARGQPAAAGVTADETGAPAPRAGARTASAARVGEHGREHAHGPRTSEVSQEQRRVSEARSTAKFEAASEEAQSRREGVERRNAERAASGKGSAPLPVPAGASAPAP